MTFFRSTLEWNLMKTTFYNQQHQLHSKNVHSPHTHSTSPPPPKKKNLFFLDVGLDTAVSFDAEFFVSLSDQLQAVLPAR